MGRGLVMPRCAATFAIASVQIANAGRILHPVRVVHIFRMFLLLNIHEKDFPLYRAYFYKVACTILTTSSNPSTLERSCGEPQIVPCTGPPQPPSSFSISTRVGVTVNP